MSKRRSYFRSDFYRRVLKSRKPGQSLASLAKEHDISPARLYSYRAYLKRSQAQDTETLRPPHPSNPLIPIVIKAASPGASFDLTLEGLGTLKIPADFDPASLKRLIQALRTSAC